MLRNNEIIEHTSSHAHDILWRLPIKPKREDELIYQLNDLAKIAKRLGLHDAADWIHKNSFTPQQQVFEIHKLIAHE